MAVASHQELLSTAVDCGAKQIERFATSRTLLVTAQAKRNLAPEAEAVEMEKLYNSCAEVARR